MGAADRSELRDQMLARWERGATGWRRRADDVRRFGMPVSVWLIDHLDLQPGEDVLELAAGPGDTGFLAAEQIAPNGKVISSDGAEAMLDLARARAGAYGLDNVEFKRLDLEWIDLPTASVDAVICRWGLMLVVDPGSALTEIRRVLRPGGRAAIAVWAAPEDNPWATTPGRALVGLGLAEPPDPDAPGMFALADKPRLTELLESAGFTDVTLERVELSRSSASVDEYIAEQIELSLGFAEAFTKLSRAERQRVRSEIAELARPWTGEEGTVDFPARSLVALAHA